jgi:hypothetical protein
MALIETPEEGDVHRDDVAIDSLTILGRVLWQCFPQLSGTCAGRLLREAVEAGVPTEFECVSPIIDRWLWVRVDPLPSGITGV